VRRATAASISTNIVCILWSLLCSEWLRSLRAAAAACPYKVAGNTNCCPGVFTCAVFVPQALLAQLQQHSKLRLAQVVQLYSAAAAAAWPAGQLLDEQQ
jgi:hypothetical protein